ncbi:hypothetical protein [Geodermatophilus sp. URMC 62]|uniref:hypothetical protein n=1 Tax=Geodermatophilus sp. URMC 62 TaxID=3423414 RepID=UPI00406C1A39
MPSGFKINQQGIAQMKREIEREFAKDGGVRIPLNADSSDVARAAATYNTYYGPVVHSNGHGVQIAFGNEHVTQNQVQTEQVTPGFEELARAVGLLTSQLAEAPLSDEERATAAEAGNDVLNEVVKPEPDRSSIRKGLAALKGVLAPIAAGMVTGASQAASADAQQWAHEGLQLLHGVVF